MRGKKNQEKQTKQNTHKQNTVKFTNLAGINFYQQIYKNFPFHHCSSNLSSRRAQQPNLQNTTGTCSYKIWSEKCFAFHRWSQLKSCLLQYCPLNCIECDLLQSYLRVCCPDTVFECVKYHCYQ